MAVPLGFYNQNKVKNIPPQQTYQGYYQMLMKGVTNIGFRMANNKLLNLNGLEAHLLRGKKYF